MLKTTDSGHQSFTFVSFCWLLAENFKKSADKKTYEVFMTGVSVFSDPPCSILIFVTENKLNSDIINSINDKYLAFVCAQRLGCYKQHFHPLCFLEDGDNSQSFLKDVLPVGKNESVNILTSIILHRSNIEKCIILPKQIKLCLGGKSYNLSKYAKPPESRFSIENHGRYMKVEIREPDFAALFDSIPVKAPENPNPVLPEAYHDFQGIHQAAFS